jgi:hypothetical protein
MKTRFFYGVFTGFILGCLFFFGLTQAKGSTIQGDGDGQYATGAGTVGYDTSGYLGTDDGSRGITTEGGTLASIGGTNLGEGGVNGQGNGDAGSTGGQDGLQEGKGRGRQGGSSLGGHTKGGPIV